ncbi:hypothetical protein PybrP1_009073 [[Pythium] brassicae (nom. inval.)]|nr:hypothetical protein PybrP1_009073 [[Pythium] brassicae (nom. inval.)]
MAGDGPSALHAPRDGGVGGGRVSSATDTAVVVKSEHLSAADEAVVRLLPGNDRCADCKAAFPQWAAVSFGVLVCLACAGQHRALGVGVSFVKSLAMDSWSLSERRSLEVGGNAKWTAVCTATATNDLPLARKYTSSVAEAYRRRIQTTASDPSRGSEPHTATEFLSRLARASFASLDSELPLSAVAEASPVSLPPPAASPTESTSSTSSTPPLPPAPPLAGADTLSVKCTTCRFLVPLEHLDAHSKACVVGPSTEAAWHKYERRVGVPGLSLGFSLTKTTGGFAEVTRVVPGGEAERLAVVLGSYVVGVNDASMTSFDEIVELVRGLPRPILFRFVVRASSSGASAMATPPKLTDRTLTRSAPTISSVPEPISVAVEITFNERELGCSLQVREHGCVVLHVDKGGPAHTRGVLVGSRIVEVNGRRFLKPEEVIREIQTSRRPMRVKFHRVEGLMRGWNRR